MDYQKIYNDIIKIKTEPVKSSVLEGDALVFAILR